MFKTQLNLFTQQHKIGSAVFSTEQKITTEQNKKTNIILFQSKVECMGETFIGDLYTNKKSSENSAAEKMMNFISNNPYSKIEEGDEEIEIRKFKKEEKIKLENCSFGFLTSEDLKNSNHDFLYSGKLKSFNVYSCKDISERVNMIFDQMSVMLKSHSLRNAILLISLFCNSSDLDRFTNGETGVEMIELNPEKNYNKLTRKDLCTLGDSFLKYHQTKFLLKRKLENDEDFSLTKEREKIENRIFLSKKFFSLFGPEYIISSNLILYRYDQAGEYLEGIIGALSLIYGKKLTKTICQDWDLFG